ncbi:GH1 family beta-glucosidase [Buchananella hordeovulneris]|uniref:GH1 family beta-glucosidase n=1 Tax=Buchananella hordeovulneris TaxID=52770 RepID=UPI000F603651|nr:GH1 family beta-glucosidase [Buchananella hordeovulneris]RRD44568.1 beta-glucosidase [Buchananella hordeovulneris]RRD52674.1 beta-glucosidase [Buchananella hordeovulneris]
MTTLQFPPDFQFGAATAAFQIEGGGYEDGRGPSIWDAFCEEPGRIADGSNGLVACDHYHRMEQDVALMRSLHLATYRFSTSWARVCPDGRSVNQRGLDFYSRLVDELLAANIKPWLTLYHWDLPQALGEQGGWVSRETSYRFADYTQAVHDALGDRVGVWTTLNEPWCSSFLSYACGEHAPGHTSPREAVAAAHHLLLAHGLGVQVLREAASNLTVGITCNTSYFHPADPDNPADVDAARRVDGAFHRVFLDPLFKGHYPDDVLEDMREAGLGEDVRDGDMALISAPLDVLGVNFYNGGAHAAPLPGAQPEVRINAGGHPVASPIVGSETVRPIPRDLPVTAMGWEVDARDLRLMLNRMQRDYTGPAGIPLVVTENGAAYHDVPDEHGYVDDTADRLAYLRDHLAAVHGAIADGVDVRGYLAWSLLDNFEWAFGYSRRFGIVRVDYDTLARIPKASAKWYAEVARTHTMEIG